MRWVNNEKVSRTSSPFSPYFRQPVLSIYSYQICLLCLKFIPTKSAYIKASSNASEPYKTPSANLGLEIDHDNNFVPSINIRHDLSLITIPEPVPWYKIKGATNYISKNIGKWKISSFPRTVHHFWLLVRIYHGQDLVIEAIHGLSKLYKRDSDGNT